MSEVDATGSVHVLGAREFREQVMTMIRAIAALAMGLVLVGCGGGADSVIGSWELEKEKTLVELEKQLDAGGGGEAMGGEMAKAMMKGMIESASVNLEMSDDNTFSVTGAMGPGQFSIKGTWEKVSGGYRLSPTDGDTDKTPITARIEDGLFVMPPDEGDDEPTFYLKKKA